MSTTRASTCSHRTCRNTTLDATRRCHLHRGSYTALTAGPSIIPPPVTLAGGVPWKPDAKTPHPTGGYDYIDEDEYSTVYSHEGLTHRTDGPASIRFTSKGDLYLEAWWNEGKRHREDGPAETYYDPEDGITSEKYFRNGTLHRLDGPADIEYGSDGGVNAQWFYIEGTQVGPDEFAEVVEQVKSGAPVEWALAFAEGGSE